MGFPQGHIDALAKLLYETQLHAQGVRVAEMQANAAKHGYPPIDFDWESQSVTCKATWRSIALVAMEHEAKRYAS